MKRILFTRGVTLLQAVVLLALVGVSAALLESPTAKGQYAGAVLAMEDGADGSSSTATTGTTGEIEIKCEGQKLSATVGATEEGVKADGKCSENSQITYTTEDGATITISGDKFKSLYAECVGDSSCVASRLTGPAVKSNEAKALVGALEAKRGDAGYSAFFNNVVNTGITDGINGAFSDIKSDLPTLQTMDSRDNTQFTLEQLTKLKEQAQTIGATGLAADIEALRQQEVSRLATQTGSGILGETDQSTSVGTRSVSSGSTFVSEANGNDGASAKSQVLISAEKRVSEAERALEEAKKTEESGWFDSFGGFFSKANSLVRRADPIAEKEAELKLAEANLARVQEQGGVSQAAGSFQERAAASSRNAQEAIDAARASLGQGGSSSQGGTGVNTEEQKSQPTSFRSADQGKDDNVVTSWFKDKYASFKGTFGDTATLEEIKNRTSPTNFQPLPSSGTSVAGGDTQSSGSIGIISSANAAERVLPPPPPVPPSAEPAIRTQSIFDSGDVGIGSGAGGGQDIFVGDEFVAQEVPKPSTPDIGFAPESPISGASRSVTGPAKEDPNITQKAWIAINSWWTANTPATPDIGFAQEPATPDIGFSESPLSGASRGVAGPIEQPQSSGPLQRFTNKTVDLTQGAYNKIFGTDNSTLITDKDSGVGTVEPQIVTLLDGTIATEEYRDALLDQGTRVNTQGKSDAGISNAGSINDNTTVTTSGNQTTAESSAPSSGLGEAPDVIAQREQEQAQLNQIFENFDNTSVGSINPPAAQTTGSADPTCQGGLVNAGCVARNAWSYAKTATAQVFGTGSTPREEGSRLVNDIPPTQPISGIVGGGRPSQELTPATPDIGFAQEPATPDIGFSESPLSGASRGVAGPAPAEEIQSSGPLQRFTNRTIDLTKSAYDKYIAGLPMTPEPATPDIGFLPEPPVPTGFEGSPELPSYDWAKDETINSDSRFQGIDGALERYAGLEGKKLTQGQIDTQKSNIARDVQALVESGRSDEIGGYYAEVYGNLKASIPGEASGSLGNPANVPDGLEFPIKSSEDLPSSHLELPPLSKENCAWLDFGCYHHKITHDICYEGNNSEYCKGYLKKFGVRVSDPAESTLQNTNQNISSTGKIDEIADIASRVNTEKKSDASVSGAGAGDVPKVVNPELPSSRPGAKDPAPPDGGPKVVVPTPKTPVIERRPTVRERASSLWDGLYQSVLGGLLQGLNTALTQQQTPSDSNSSGSNSGTTVNPAALAAELSCAPRTQEVGAPIVISYACRGANTARSDGFDNGGKLGGSATSTAAFDIERPGSTSHRFALTCAKDGQIKTATCEVEVIEPSVVVVANPNPIQSGNTTRIGWLSSGMKSCTIKSGDGTTQANTFNELHKNAIQPNGAATTPALTQNLNVVVTCLSKNELTTKTATTTVEVR